MRGTRLYLVSHKKSYNCNYIVRAQNKNDAIAYVYEVFMNGRAKECGIAHTDFSCDKIELEIGEMLRI